MRFYISLLNVWSTIPQRIVMSVLRRIYGLFAAQMTFIHTPKCAGSYVYKQYGLNRKLRIRPVGHGRLMSVSGKRDDVVGLIRQPADWYLSYFNYCKYGLSIAPQTRYNFPATHPIPVFSLNTTITPDEMVANMANNEFIDALLDAGIVANIYTRDTPDMFEFMKRTGCGFWTWTMMYHFGQTEIVDLRSREDVITEAGRIAQRTRFIRQENIDADVSAILDVPLKQGKRVNTQTGDKVCKLSDASISNIVSLDGDVAAILGGYD